ncbi:MAG: exopolysaccharide biosynthesis protein [Chlamydiae bacterium RIFCSPHIGHO2_12_FULL_27_8]|nr:MAG: exopolysaccharide biosynthesis protein [Chlamydiae bacterium RIFCSPHIGHO2_12_FULL_27_8]OGN66204.1 MAG: exopolysaccharide biosynthesis protein [Chlamydiae bacterium RIFCSPLOWO2_01_FULL_28_7]
MKWFLKRVFDILFSLLVIIFISPIYVIIAISILLTSKGPVFYSSTRLGKNGKIIKCYKFRTMHLDAEYRLINILNSNIALKVEWEKFQKLKNDPRITKIGSFLRKTSLDELPQFFNVLNGDLSVVGPRAFVMVGPKDKFVDEIKTYLGSYTEKILSVKPGITGLWQISGRSNVTIEERIKIESEYIDNFSFLFDLKIILKTIPKMIFPNGAF